MKADREFIRSQQRVHAEACERAARMYETDPLVRVYVDTIASRMRREGENPMPEDTKEKKEIPLKELFQRHIENTDSEHARRVRKGGNVERKFTKIVPKESAVKD